MGERWVVIGLNGVGKIIFLVFISGELDFMEGVVYIGGKNVILMLFYFCINLGLGYVF